jgi:hypothetical protein
MKIGDIAKVSKASKSKVAGEKVIVVGFNHSRGQIKVQAVRSNGFISPRVGYVKWNHVIPEGGLLSTGEPKVKHVPITEEVESHDGYVCASNDIRGVVAQDVETTDTSHVGVDFKFPLGSPVFFETEIPFEVMIPKFIHRSTMEKHEINTMCAWVSDQWVEEGVKLYNVVFLGTFKVLPESCIKNICNRPAFA